MYYKLNLEKQNELKYLPETGMGYQIIEARFYGEYERREFVVLNEELIVENNNLRKDYFKEIFTKGFNLAIRNALYKDLRDIKLKTDSDTFSVYERGNNKSTGAKNNPLINADGKTYYVRLSAYEDDKRIDVKNNCLLPGSYTTTKRDYEKCVTDNDAPVERYALPNDEVIEWAFHILPERKDQYRFGIVEPEFGKRGGGEECYFENGTSFDTFKKKTKYGVFYP
jgi:hypothetical protein